MRAKLCKERSIKQEKKNTFVFFNLGQMRELIGSYQPIRLRDIFYSKLAKCQTGISGTCSKVLITLYSALFFGEAFSDRKI